MNIEIEREEDGRWIAEAPDLYGVMVYGQSQEESIYRVEALALRVMADQLEHDFMWRTIYGYTDN
ncbi:MAG: type II toxin-antitoxin system HicB family antitoxin [bacterium]|nr:type II toxin-antitoxin system HicB family antitoxin [bacterium]